MASQEQQPRPAVLSLLLFSDPPRETPSIIRAAAAVTSAHALVLALLLWLVLLARNSDLPSGVMEPPDRLDFELLSLPIGLASAAGPAPAPKARAQNRARPARKRILGAPAIAPAPAPPVETPADIPPAILGNAIDNFKMPKVPSVSAVPPRGVAPAAPASGNGATAGMGSGTGNDVASMSLDELAREPVYTPFTQAPELINRAEIRGFLQTRYPVYMSSRGIGGRAVLWILIDAVGGIRKAVLLRSSGSSVLDDAALEAIDRMEFRPAINHGKRVPVWVQLPISFQPNW